MKAAAEGKKKQVDKKKAQQTTATPTSPNDESSRCVYKLHLECLKCGTKNEPIA